MRRRDVIGLALAVGTSACVGPAWSAAGDCRLPLPSELESGDLIWPRQQATIVPYSSKANKEAAGWPGTRADLVERLRSKARTDAHRRLVGIMQELSYEELTDFFGRGHSPTAPAPHSGGALVGHVAIVDKAADGSVHLTEALLEGVVRRPYSEWARDVGGLLVWHGRVRGFAASERARIAEVARLHVGTSYDFVNWQLDDTSGFYCSKLVWFATREALGIAIDDVDDAERWWWLSPKQILYSNRIELLRNPGDYGLPNSCK